MTLVSLLTLIGALATIVTSVYNLYHYLCVWHVDKGTASGLLSVISFMTGILGTYFILVWFIQLEGGYVAMPIRHAWRSIALVATLATALLQTGLLLNVRKEK